MGSDSSIGMELKNMMWAINSHAASDKAMYSASIVDNVTDVCFCDVKDIEPPFIMKM